MSTVYTALALVVDRSGSMHNIQSDVKGYVKQLIRDQKKQEGKSSMTIAQFDDGYDVVHDFEDLTKIDEEKFANQYAPRGSTALLDAIGRTTLKLEQKLENMAEPDRPKRIVVAIVTDGVENSSKEFTLPQIKEMVKEKEALGWDFAFWGATLDTIKIAESMGFSSAKTAIYTSDNYENCMSSISAFTSRVRQNKKAEISTEERKELINSKTST